MYLDHNITMYNVRSHIYFELFIFGEGKEGGKEEGETVWLNDLLLEGIFLDLISKNVQHFFSSILTALLK